MTEGSALDRLDKNLLDLTAGIVAWAARRHCLCRNTLSLLIVAAIGLIFLLKGILVDDPFVKTINLLVATVAGYVIFCRPDQYFPPIQTVRIWESETRKTARVAARWRQSRIAISTFGLFIVPYGWILFVAYVTLEGFDLRVLILRIANTLDYSLFTLLAYLVSTPPAPPGMAEHRPNQRAVTGRV